MRGVLQPGQLKTILENIPPSRNNYFQTSLQPATTRAAVMLSPDAQDAYLESSEEEEEEDHQGSSEEEENSRIVGAQQRRQCQQQRTIFVEAVEEEAADDAQDSATASDNEAAPCIVATACSEDLCDTAPPSPTAAVESAKNPRCLPPPPPVGVCQHKHKYRNIKE